MNNKGFAISSILYLLILIAGVLLLSTLAMITFRKDVLTSRLDAINRELEGSFATQYRYITESGEWSDWIDYSDKSEINHTVNIKRIPNLGTRGNQYDLDSTNVTLEIINGEAYLEFNGIDSKAECNLAEETVINTAVIEVKKDNIGGIIGLRSDIIEGFFFTSATGYENAFRVGSDVNYLTTNVAYNNNDTYKFVITMNKETGSYYIYEDGSLVGTTGYVDILRATSIGLGYLRYASYPLYLQGAIYNVSLSAGILSQRDAMKLSSMDEESNLRLYGISPEIEYNFIEYRTVNINEKDELKDVFKTQYIRDYINGSTASLNNDYLEIETYARFELYNSFKNIMVGGNYTGSYQSDTDYNGNVALGKIRISNGTFTHPNTNEYLYINNMEILTPYTTINSYGSGFIVFIGSDSTRFIEANQNSFNAFVYAEYDDKDNDGDNEWAYYNGTDWVAFTPSKEDALVGYAEKYSGSSSIDKLELFSDSFTFNVALNKDITSSYGVIDGSGYSITRVNNGVNSGAEIFTNGTSDHYIEIDLGTEYNIVKVIVYRASINHTYFNTNTIIYNEDKTEELVLWDYNEDGLYIESSLGTQLYVDQNKMPTTEMARYITDCSNGRYLVSDGSYDPTNVWYEIQGYDLNGVNVALNKTVTTDNGDTTNISYVTDGNDVAVYNGGTTGMCVIIDLQYKYALKEINIDRNISNYINAYVRGYLKEEAAGSEQKTIYNSNIEGIYKGLDKGLRIIIKNTSIKDVQPPTLTLNGDNPTYVALNGTYNEPGATATDDIDGNISSQIQISGTVDTNVEGTYIITYTVQDSAGNADITSRTVEVVAVQAMANFTYTGSVQTYTVPISGTYKLEVWGAEGGIGYSSSAGGRGAYATGEINLSGGEELYIYVGEYPISKSPIYAGGYNGGGDTNSDRTESGGGGGATDIRTGGQTLYDRIIVAAGGGGGNWSRGDQTTRAGGAEVSFGTYFATQTAPGSGASFGEGADVDCSPSYPNGGGGGGWFGGGAVTGGAAFYESPSGGSSYVLTATSARPTGYNPDSKYNMLNTALTSGNDSMPNPAGGTMTGNAGNGYARITFVE